MGADISLIVAAETQVAGMITLSPEYLFGLSDNQIRAISIPKLFINSTGVSYASDTRQMFRMPGRLKNCTSTQELLTE